MFKSTSKARVPFSEAGTNPKQASIAGGALVLGGLVIAAIGEVKNLIDDHNTKKSINKLENEISKLNDAQRLSFEEAVSLTKSIGECFAKSDVLIDRGDLLSQALLSYYLVDMETVLTKRLDEITAGKQTDITQTGRNSLITKIGKLQKLGDNLPELQIFADRCKDIRNNSAHNPLKIEISQIAPTYHLIKQILNHYESLYEQVRLEKKKHYQK